MLARRLHVARVECPPPPEPMNLSPQLWRWGGDVSRLGQASTQACLAQKRIADRGLFATARVADAGKVLTVIEQNLRQICELPMLSKPQK